MYIYDLQYKGETKRVMTPLNQDELIKATVLGGKGNHYNGIKLYNRKLTKTDTIAYYLNINSKRSLSVDMMRKGITIDTWKQANLGKIQKTLDNYKVLIEESANKDEVKATPINQGYNPQDTKFGDVYNKTVKLSRSAEDKSLGKYINYYLEDLGLEPVDLDYVVNSSGDLFDLSTYGDGVCEEILTNMGLEPSIIHLFSTNASQQIALVRLGYYEFGKSMSTADQHLVGTYFEALLACASLQKRDDVVKKLIDALTGIYYDNTKQSKFDGYFSTTK